MSLHAVPKLAAPNHCGFSMGHIHIMSPDVSESERAFLALGAPYVHQVGTLRLLPFENAYVLLSSASNSGGNTSSVVTSVLFNVRSITEAIARLRDAGIDIRQAGAERASAIITVSEVMIELIELPELDSPAQFSAVTLSTTDVDSMQEWYARHFGASDGHIPGAEFRYRKVVQAPAPTKGRCLDHIGFETKDLLTFYKENLGAGLHFEGTPRTAPNAITKVVFLRDPWGTRIELTENLQALAQSR